MSGLNGLAAGEREHHVHFFLQGAHFLLLPGRGYPDASRCPSPIFD
jgi:hypothetical protein